MDRSEPRAARDRPPDVTASAMILIVLGVLGLFANTVVLMNPERIPAVSRGAVTIASAAGLVISSLEVMSGTMILRLSNAWRIVAIVIGVLGVGVAVLNSFSLGFSIGTILVAAANAYVVVTLIRLRDAFGS